MNYKISELLSETDLTVLWKLCNRDLKRGNIGSKPYKDVYRLKEKVEKHIINLNK